MKWTMTKIPVIKGLDRFFTSIMGVTSYNKTGFFLHFIEGSNPIQIIINIQKQNQTFLFFCHNDIITKNTPYWAMRPLQVFCSVTLNLYQEKTNYVDGLIYLVSSSLSDSSNKAPNSFLSSSDALIGPLWRSILGISSTPTI